MSNSIALATKYLPLLDEVYKVASKTSVLDMANSEVKFLGANKVEIYKLAMQGLGNYSRATGFVDGDVTGIWEEKTLTQDRGRSFSVDSMDNEESLGMAFGKLAGEFIRTQVVPEIDAYRFATYSANAGTTASADISNATDVASLIDTAEQVMNDAEVPAEGKILFLSETAYKQLKTNIVRTVLNAENGISRTIETYDGMPIVRVPKARFNTAITLKTGGAGQTEGGYVVPASTSYPINFMIVHPSAVAQVVKHAVPRIFSPDVNQKADAWKFDYRVYHDCFKLDNKAKGIYLHKASTANA